ncbi:chaperonin 10-like protein [Hyaloraphidium curvatum]|nr:chaperonin 10-like protein [Hyaloraphidium curvatum]
MAQRAVTLTAFGGPEKLAVRDGPVPEPGPGQARVRVLASTVNFTDTLIRRGKYPDLREKPPLVTGYDLVGEVDAVGPGVTSVKAGQRVADLTMIGSHARYTLRPADGLVPVPDDLDPTQIVPLVLSGMTAYQLLFRDGGVNPSQTVLVHGGNGAVGRAAIQLARDRGIRVITTARPEFHDALRALGAEPLDYADAEWPEKARKLTGGEGCDVVLDHAGADGWAPSRRAARDRGKLVLFGLSEMVRKGDSMLSILYSLVRAMVLWNVLPWGPYVSFYSIMARRAKLPGDFREDLGQLIDAVRRGVLTVQVERKIGFDEVTEAHREIDAGGTKGWRVLVPS